MVIMLLLNTITELELNSFTQVDNLFMISLTPQNDHEALNRISYVIDYLIDLDPQRGQICIPYQWDAYVPPYGMKC